MKIIMYGTGKAEREYVQDWMEETGNEVKMVSDQLNDRTIDLAQGFDGISIQQTKPFGDPAVYQRSEERRVGKECRSRWSPYH